MVVFMGIDPTPPPKDTEVITSQNLDDAVIVVIGLHEGKVYVLEYYQCKSPNPDEFISKIFEFVIKYKPFKIGFESILFARTMKFYLEKEQRRRHHYFTVTPVEDRRKKSVRIQQALTNRASARMLYVHRSQVELIQQFTMYPNVKHDDILDALAIALDLINPALEDGVLEGEFSVIEDDDIPALEDWRSAI